MRGFGARSTESTEWRGKSSWSCAEEEDEEDMEKREEARERDVSESELSRRSGAAERSDARPPPFRCRSSSFRDLAAEELDALEGVAGTGDGEGEVDGDAGGFCGVCTFLSLSSSRQRLEHVGALGENTYGSNASGIEGRSVLTSSGVAGISAAAGAVCGSRSASGAASATGCGRSGSSLPSANSSSAGSMVPDPPKLNSKSMNSLDTAAACSALHAVASP
jgi:hypothetical protein